MSWQQEPMGAVTPSRITRKTLQDFVQQCTDAKSRDPVLHNGKVKKVRIDLTASQADLLILFGRLLGASKTICHSQSSRGSASQYGVSHSHDTLGGKVPALLSLCVCYRRVRSIALLFTCYSCKHVRMPTLVDMKFDLAGQVPWCESSGAHIGHPLSRRKHSLELSPHPRGAR